MSKIYPHIATILDLFYNYDVTRLTGKGNIKRTYKCQDKAKLVRQVFLRFMEIMFDDFIEGGKVFTLPCKRYSEFRFKEIDQHIFKASRKLGVYKDVDILMTRGRHYQIVMNHKGRGEFQTCQVALCKPLTARIIEKVNNGHKYC